MLFEADGQLLWLNDEARARLSVDALRVGPHVALHHCEALERLRAWVRGEARCGEPGGPHPSPAWGAAAPGEALVLRRFGLASGRTLFLVGFAGAAPGAAPGPGDGPDQDAALRAARFARRHALTRRQAEVLGHVAVGKANKVIAAAAPRTPSRCT